jgi:hypothetical protein
MERCFFFKRCEARVVMIWEERNAGKMHTASRWSIKLPSLVGFFERIRRTCWSRQWE